jgi:hypothetical protein
MPRARRSRDELRTLLLGEGRAILHAEGLESGSSNLTFKRVFDRVEDRTGERITNASVIRRVWENQAEFQADVLVAIAHDDTRPEIGSTVGAIAGVLGDLDLSTPASRERSLGRLLLVAGNTHAAAVADSTNWPLWINVVAMVASTADVAQRKRVQEALAESYASASGFWFDTVGALVATFGLRVRPGFGLAQFVTAVTAYSEGCSLRQRTTGHTEMIDRPTGPGGELQPWSLFAVGLEALVHQFLEPDPDR